MSFHIPLHTSTYFHEYHKLPAASTRLPIGPTDFRSIYFHGSWWKLPWKFPRSFLQLTWKLTWKSIYFHGSFQSVEEYLLPWKFSMQVGGRRFTFMEVSGSLHATWKFTLQWKWKFPLLPPIAASTNIFRGSFHGLPYTLHTFCLLYTSPSPRDQA